MMLGIKRFLLLFSFIPSVCFGIGLDTKIAWEPWAINSALMDFCMPELEEGKTVTDNMSSHWLYTKKELSSLGNVPMLITNWDEGGLIKQENVNFMPKCAAFIDKYIDKTKKNPMVSLNQIISMCLDTIQDKLICENVALVLVNLTENKKALKKYDPEKMQQKIQNSIKADHIICSEDGDFCTTYNLFADRNTLEKLTDGDAIYKKADNDIVGICAGVGREDVKFLSVVHGNSRCVSTNQKYELYEFDIQDFTDKSIKLVYTDWGAAAGGVKKYLERINGMIGDLEKCVATKQQTSETYRALKADYAILGLDLCERDNSTQNAIVICKTQVLRLYLEKTIKKVQELTFEKAEDKLEIYKSMVKSYFLEAKVLQHQTDLVLTECEGS